MKPKPTKQGQIDSVESDLEKGSVSELNVQHTASSDIQISPVSSRRIIDPKTFEQQNERDVEEEAAVMSATLASKIIAAQRQRFEEAMGKRASRKTLVAELEGDSYGVGKSGEKSGTFSMPSRPLEVEKGGRPSALNVYRHSNVAVVGTAQQFTVVKGKDNAVIVRVGSVRRGHLLNSSRELSQRELPLLPSSIRKVHHEHGRSVSNGG